MNRKQWLVLGILVAVAIWFALGIGYAWGYQDARENDHEKSNRPYWFIRGFTIMQLF